MTIKLTQEELSFLTEFLRQRFPFAITTPKDSVNDDNTISIFLDDDTALDIREELGSEVGRHFDEKYEPTKNAIVIESLIDKLYDSNH